MHPGTQTLIQAIQALPWTEEEEPDDADNSEGSSDTDEECMCFLPPVCVPNRAIVLATVTPPSKHAISQSTSEQNSNKTTEGIQPQQHDSTVTGVNDGSARIGIESLPKDGISRLNHEPSRDAMTHNGSYANFLSQHRMDLAAKLREAFEMDDISEVIAGMSILQGF